MPENDFYIFVPNDLDLGLSFSNLFSFTRI